MLNTPSSFVHAVTHLYGPPPVPSMHITVNAVRSILIGEVPFRCKDQIMLKFRVTKERPEAWNNLPVVKREDLASNGHIL